MVTVCEISFNYINQRAKIYDLSVNANIEIEWKKVQSEPWPLPLETRHETQSRALV